MGKVVNQYKVAKHFELVDWRQRLPFAQDRRHRCRAALDGIYIIRTSVPTTQMDASRCVRSYKALANVARVPLAQDDRSEGAPDPPPHR
ncbi:hypothetical protein [Variovorax sp. WS11]|uniref:hypothetical protein n=1 Tax=Variovorax sp. WS11 TaxID=1105204 RepID=UPI0013D8E714|nr:hypothetical protein [Variovorax sp. WS11]NDZ13412.1 hypothetical protein [Variovorax sp. WS11]